jgi:hypothetical protein
MPNLGTGYFEVSEECRALEPSLNLGWTRSLEEAFDRFLEIVQSLFYRLAMSSSGQRATYPESSGFNTALKVSEGID